MKDEEWLKRMKERLEDFTESAPLSGWERLEKDLSVSSAPIPSRRLPLYRYWGVSAAAVLLLAVSTVSIWLLNSSLPEEVGQSVPMSVRQPVVVQAASQSSVETEKSVKLSDKRLPVSPAEQMCEVSHVRMQHVEVAKDTLLVGVSVVDDNTKEKVAADLQDMSMASDSVHEENASTEKSPRRDRYRPSASDKYHLPAATGGREKQARWSVALALGNTGGFAAQHSAGSAMLQQASALSVNGKLDLSATSNGLLAIPAGQEVVFRDGIPYLSSRTPVIESVEHKQPISVGMSVRKVLSKGFSIETGLMYTFLSSDVVFSGHVDKLEQKLHYLGIPLRINWSFMQKTRFELYVSAGGALEKCIYGKLGSEEQTVKPVQLSVLGAVGAQVNLTHRLGIYIEPGVSYYFDDGSSVQTIRKENPCNFTLQGGIRLTY